MKLQIVLSLIAEIDAAKARDSNDEFFLDIKKHNYSHSNLTQSDKILIE